MTPDAALAAIGRALLTELPDAVVMSDREGLVRFWNDGAQRIFGFTREEAMGRSLDLIVPERLRARHWEGYRRMMATGRMSHGPEELLSVPALSKSGAPLSIQFTVACVRAADGTVEGIVAVMRDVTATFQELKHLRAARG